MYFPNTIGKNLKRPALFGIAVL